MSEHDIHWRLDREAWVCRKCGHLWEKYPSPEEGGECDA